MSRGQHLRNLAVLGAWAIALALLPHALTVYLRSFLLFTMMYVVLALGWNIISGFTGYTSFGHVAFYGIGAYACAILVTDYGWPWVPTLLVGAGAAALVALAIGYPVLRLKGPYFAIAMLGAAEGTRVVATVWDSLTHGGLGISLPSAETSLQTYYAMLVLMLVTILAAYAVAHSRFGIRLNAIREDEVAAAALGIDATRYKLAAFVLSAVFPAVAGGIQAYKVLYIDPPSVFFVQITIAMALMSMLGGKGTVIGPILGAVILYTAQELTWVNFPTAHLIAYGLFIILVARFMPRGLVGFAIDQGWVRKGMVHG
jgi:branched-chain amino acid transport system permease protein